MNYTFSSLIYKCQSPVCDQDTVSEIGIPLKNIMTYISNQESEIKERQILFADFLAEEQLFSLFSELEKRLDSIQKILILIGESSDKETETLFYKLRELTVFTDCIHILEEGAHSLLKKVRSERLRSFFETVLLISENENYRAMEDWLNGLDSRIRNLSSVTLGVNLNANMEVTEIGLVSFNDKHYMGSAFFQKILRNKKPEEAFECIASVGNKDGGITDKTALLIHRELYDAVNGVLRKTVKKIHKFLSEEIRASATSLALLHEEIVFIIKSVSFVRQIKAKGLPVAFPSVESRENIQKLYNPLLCYTMQADKIIPSDLSFEEKTQIAILTGPNSGGKTVYVRALGIAQMLFQSGLPVFAEKAEMKIYDSVATHFIKTATNKTESRLAQEAARLQKSLLKLRGTSLFLLDETFSGTNAYDASLLAEALIKHLETIPCDAVYITHLHDLPERILSGKEQGKYGGVQLLCAKTAGGKRQFKIVSYEQQERNFGFIKDILVENGLGFLLKD